MGAAVLLQANESGDIPVIDGLEIAVSLLKYILIFSGSSWICQVIK